MVFDRKTLVVPDKTKFEEYTIFTKGDVVIGDRCLLRFGVKTDGRIFVGEHVIIDGELDASKDVRIDIFSNISGNIKSGGNVYIGEKTKVKGKLSLKGDLDVGDSVEIEDGFEAKGWINIRNPIPIVIYIFIYLMQLLKMGHSEEIDRILKEIEENNGDTIPISEIFLFIPDNSIIGNQKSRIDYSLKIGKGCKILGNYDIKGNVTIGNDTEIHGSIKSSGDVYCGKNVVVQGNINTNGDIILEEKTEIAGDITGKNISLTKTTSVKGKLFSKDGISFDSSSEENIEEKITRFEKNVDIKDEVDDILE
jgi:predicted acyltransferase (DUF342 family)